MDVLRDLRDCGTFTYSTGIGRMTFYIKGLEKPASLEVPQRLWGEAQRLVLLCCRVPGYVWAAVRLRAVLAWPAAAAARGWYKSWPSSRDGSRLKREFY
jgi:hypothetical protein